MKNWNRICAILTCENDAYHHVVLMIFSIGFKRGQRKKSDETANSNFRQSSFKDGYREIKPILNTTFLTYLSFICDIRCRKGCHWNFSVIQVKKKKNIHLDFLFQICFTSYPGGFISSKLTCGNAWLLNTVLDYLMLSLVVVGGHLHYWKGVSPPQCHVLNDYETFCGGIPGQHRKWLTTAIIGLLSDDHSSLRMFFYSSFKPAFTLWLECDHFCFNMSVLYLLNVNGQLNSVLSWLSSVGPCIFAVAA